MKVQPTLALIATGVWGPGFLLSFVMMAFSAMMFDAPGSEDVVWTKLLFASIASAPLLCLISVVGSWIAWAVTRESEPARGVMLRTTMVVLPLVSVAFVAVAAALLQAKCGGSFSCRG